MVACAFARATLSGRCAKRRLYGALFAFSLVLVSTASASAGDGVPSLATDTGAAGRPRCRESSSGGESGCGGPAREEGSATASATSARRTAEKNFSMASPARRMTAVGTKFQTGPVMDLTGVRSSIQAVPANETNIDVYAGVVYPTFNILATSGLGDDIDKIRVKLVPFDMAATMKTCAEVEPAGNMKAPFNGASGVALPDAEESLNEFTNVQFPIAGRFRLCYSADSVKWEELVPGITVMGAEFNDQKVWCPLSLLTREICQNVHDTIGCECQGMLEGLKRQNTTPFELKNLGMNNQPYPHHWQLMLTEDGVACGGNVDQPQRFYRKFSEVSYGLGFEIHNFGHRVGGTGLGRWNLCYCPGFDKDREGIAEPLETCNTEGDFPQVVGQLTTVRTATMYPSTGTEISVYPTMRFSMQIQCGATIEFGTGGCQSTTEPRYKIINRNAAADLPYFDLEAGCRFMEQAKTVLQTTDGNMVIGGHLAPDNCIAAALCSDEPDVMGPKIPTFDDVQIDGSYENNVMIEQEYDVCYCDENCQNRNYWFKAGSIKVLPVTMTFKAASGFDIAEPIVATNYFILLQGLEGTGGWKLEADGDKTREMKILKDNGGFVDKTACLTEPQPDEVSGHRLVSGNVDYTSPSSTIDGRFNLGQGQEYGSVESRDGSKGPNIKLLEAGWYAVCYCNENCNQLINWAVFGRVVVSGPRAKDLDRSPIQNWVRYAGVSFNLEVTGWALKTENRIRILSPSNTLQDCGLQEQSDRVWGPADSASLLNQATYTAVIRSITWNRTGSEITFSNFHHLEDGDYIKLENINVFNSIKRTHMFNSVHLVSKACDSVLADGTKCHKILVPLKFPGNDFPIIDTSTTRWTRSSQQLYENIKIGGPSPDDRGFVVCWSASGQSTEDYIGQAGYIDVKEPLYMPETELGFGLTTVEPGSPGEAIGAPVMIAFMTSDIALYSQVTGSMSLRFVIMPGQETVGGPYEDAIEFRDYKLKPVELGEINQRSKANQAFCGTVFSEMWADDPDGFPQPDGCFYDEDTTNPAMRLRQLHIVFGPKNHLKRNTKYVVVMNMNVLDNLREDFPANGPLHVLSMGDYSLNPFHVVEQGLLYPAPLNRAPPRDAEGNLKLTDTASTDPMFHSTDGFKIMDLAGQETDVIEMKKYCIASSVSNPGQTPASDKQCMECRTEEDCGNSDPALVWCSSPLDAICFLPSPQFTIRIRAKVGHPIVRTNTLRIFFHPLTQWDMNPPKCQAKIGWFECTAPGGIGDCGQLTCTDEAVVEGPIIGIPKYPINMFKLTFPIMEDITDTMMHTISVSSLRIPPGGFFPQKVTAEISKQDDSCPNYFGLDHDPSTYGGARLYRQPQVVSAAIVNFVGDGNQAPFRGDVDNRLFIRFVMGTTLFALTETLGITLTLTLPIYEEFPAQGYDCATEQYMGSPPELGVIGGVIPSGQGRLGGYSSETVWERLDQPKACQLTFKNQMIQYAYSPVFFEIAVDNPLWALKATDPTNKIILKVMNLEYELSAPDYTLDSDQPGYSGSVSVLGKLMDMIIAPTNFGVSQANWLMAFFKTEQNVGDMYVNKAQVWIDAPSSFDFQRYCAAKGLESTYHIPEANPETFRLPLGEPPVCNGGVTRPTERSYNRAIIITAGRLLYDTLYGFQVRVMNGPVYVRQQLNEWRIWTYSAAGDGVDGAFETVRVNPQEAVGENTSFGMYPMQMPVQNFQVYIDDLRPTPPGGSPTYITVRPIIVQVPMQKGVRIIAPAGYEWNFEPSDFRYKKAGPGVLDFMVIDDVDADLPVSGTPAMPIAEPKNVLLIDYMTGAWIPGLRYGFMAKIIVPNVPPTRSANQFTIEFGYSGQEQAERLEGGVFTAPVVQRLINGGITYTTNIVGQDTLIQFEFRTITHIPRSGGIVILGPPNFKFYPALCMAKAVSGYPEFPSDATCLYQATLATGAPEVSIVAGQMGIRPAHYKFTLTGINPPAQILLEDAGDWTISSYSVMSPNAEQRVTLDETTRVPGFSTNVEMLSATFNMPPKVACAFRLVEPITNCKEEDFQFYPPRGYRSDLPSVPSALMLMFQLRTDVMMDGELLLRAPVGYEFNPECNAEEDSAQVFNALAEEGSEPTRDFILQYQVWPTQAAIQYCKGKDNQARLFIKRGLKGFTKPYVLRISVLKNPDQTPDPNLFNLEYNGESSLPFEGVPIWAFNDGVVIPTTTAASIRARPTTNVVTIQLRAVNDVPTEGMVRVEAPSGFLIRGMENPTECVVSLRIHHTEAPNMTSFGIGTADQLEAFKWAGSGGTVTEPSFASPQEIYCQGDDTPSSRARLIFNKPSYMKAGILYNFEVTVWNPQTTSVVGKEWLIRSFETTSLNNLIDTIRLPGFPINYVVEAFAYLTPSSYNALVRQKLDFNISFPDDVELGDTIQVVAPLTFYFGLQGDSRCPEYMDLEGALRRTKPKCGANTISWYMEEEALPALSALRFVVEIKNGPSTPELNEFQVKQISPDGSRKSSRMILGFDIIPELEGVTVEQAVPTGYCRTEVELNSDFPCEASESKGAVTIRFTPTGSASLIGVKARVGMEAYGFSNAFLRGSNVEQHSRDAESIVATMEVRAGAEATLRLDGLINPLTTGTTLWTITTYTTAVGNDFRVDEKLDFPAFPILGYIQVMVSGSSVIPFYYGFQAATVTFELRPRVTFLQGDVLLMTRPPGYTLLDGTLRTYMDFVVSESGLDSYMKFSLDFENSPNFYMVLGATIPALSTIRFSIQAHLPDDPEKTTYWYFKSWKVLPEYDTDGELLDDSQVPYPWLKREIEVYGSNDGAFEGFLLVGQIPFTVTPSLRTPGASIQLTLVFALRAEVEGKNELNLEVMAPLGYVFKDSCLKIGSRVFSKCAGYLHTAGLTTVSRGMKGTDITIHLAVTNPGETPENNYWSIALYKDDDTQYVNYDTVLGYEIESMTASYKGNNQLGVVAPGFFTFMPVRNAPSTMVYLVFSAPASLSYDFDCKAVQPLAFKEVTQCRKGVSELELKFDNATLIRGQSYTIGIGVGNPGGPPERSDNMFGLLLKDNLKQTFDGNLRIEGLDLKSVSVEVVLLGWISAEPRVLSTIQIQFRVNFVVQPGLMKTIEIQAPNGVMYVEDPSTVQVAPRPLPLRSARPTQVMGDVLRLNLDTSQNIWVGMYNIRFEVSNPEVYPNDNTWTIRVLKDIEVEFQHVFTGYTQGEESPFEVVVMPTQSGGAWRRGAAGALPMTCALLLCALFARGGD